MTRRAALKTAATFTILPTGLLRGYAANEKLNIGLIGLAGMGEVDLKTFAGLGENIVALCDVDSTVLDKRGEVYPKARKYSDLRKMIEKEKLDGVSIAVPDHSHCYCSVWAMKHGLTCMCEAANSDRAPSQGSCPRRDRDESDHPDGDTIQRPAGGPENRRADPIGRPGRYHRGSHHD
jgi:hypothetical protein